MNLTHLILAADVRPYISCQSIRPNVDASVVPLSLLCPVPIAPVN